MEFLNPRLTYLRSFCLYNISVIHQSYVTARSLIIINWDYLIFTSASKMEYAKPPGQEPPYLPPDKTGEVEYVYPATGLKGKTTYYQWGSLSTSTNTKRTPLICVHGEPGGGHVYLRPTHSYIKTIGFRLSSTTRLNAGRALISPTSNPGKEARNGGLPRCSWQTSII